MLVETSLPILDGTVGDAGQAKGDGCKDESSKTVGSEKVARSSSLLEPVQRTRVSLQLATKEDDVFSKYAHLGYHIEISIIKAGVMGASKL